MKVSHLAKDGPRHSVKGVFEVTTKGYSLLFRYMGSPFTMVGKIALTRNANPEFARIQQTAGLLFQLGETVF